jgi:hypothetical protein
MHQILGVKRLLLAFAAITTFSFFDNCYTVSQKKYIPVTVPEVVTMSKEGVPAQKIVKKMQASHTVYRLKASQLADLKQEGVSDSVINYMQHTYLAAVKRNAELENQCYWWPGYDSYWYGGPGFGWPDWGWGDNFGGDDFFGDFDDD